MKSIIEKLMAAFGYVRAKPVQLVPAPQQPTLAEAAFHFGVREAQIRNEARMAQFEAYHTGIAQGELYGRNALASELFESVGGEGGRKPLTADDVRAAQTRVLH